MKIGIISWNIRHLRPDKVTDYLEYIMSRLVQGRIAILYENKIDNNKNGELCILLRDRLSNKLGAAALECKSMYVNVGTNENVIVVWVSRYKTGPKSKTPNTDISIAIRHVTDYNDAMWAKGVKAMKECRNETVMGNLAALRDDFRIPAILEVTVTKAGEDPKVIKIMAWHAPGPATGLPPLMWDVFQKILYNYVNLYVGDFNMTGLKEQAPISPICIHRTFQSTTITERGPVSHQEGLDLVFRNYLRIGNRAMPVQADDKFVARTTVQVIPPGDNLVTAMEVSDHLPVYIELREV